MLLFMADTAHAVDIYKMGMLLSLSLRSLGANKPSYPYMRGVNNALKKHCYQVEL